MIPDHPDNGMLSVEWGVLYSEAVGTCGITEGNYVRAVQALMWAGNYYHGGNAPISVIDGTWSEADTQAVMIFQAFHGLLGNPLAVDGCVGTNTWLALYHGLDPFGSDEANGEVGFLREGDPPIINAVGEQANYYWERDGQGKSVSFTKSVCGTIQFWTVNVSGGCYALGEAIIADEELNPTYSYCVSGEPAPPPG